MNISPRWIVCAVIVCLVIACAMTASLVHARADASFAQPAAVSGPVVRHTPPTAAPGHSQAIARSHASDPEVAPPSMQPQPPGSSSRPQQPLPRIDPSRQVDIAEGSRRLERGLQRALSKQAQAAANDGASAAGAGADGAAAGGSAATDAAAKAAATPTRLPTSPWTYDSHTEPKPRPMRGPG